MAVHGFMPTNSSNALNRTKRRESAEIVIP